MISPANRHALGDAHAGCADIMSRTVENILFWSAVSVLLITIIFVLVTEDYYYY
jgi:hypothetical protein